MSAECPPIIRKDEVERQRAELRPLRNKHATQIVLSGLAGRMLAAPGISNESVVRMPLNEATDLMPLRLDLKSVPQDRRTDLVTDLSIAAMQTGGLPEDIIGLKAGELAAIVAAEPGYVLSVFRQDSSLWARETPECVYAAGCYVANRWALPTEGFAKEDVDLLRDQLSEVDELRTSRELTMLDPVTLAQRNPLWVSHQ